jgi:hypothetical protein
MVEFEKDENAERTIAESLYAEILVLKSSSKLYTSEGCERVVPHEAGSEGGPYL